MAPVKWLNGSLVLVRVRALSDSHDTGGRINDPRSVIASINDPVAPDVGVAVDTAPHAGGARFVQADDVQARTSAVGFIGASSMERLPVEVAITDTVRAFKAAPLGRRA